MAKAKKNEPAATPATKQADKLYLHIQSESGYSLPMSVMLPLTDVGRANITEAIDNGDRAEVIDEERFNSLRTDSGLNLERPSDEKHAEVCKLADYEPMIKKTISCSEYFDHQFTSDEIKQMAAEFSEATARKSDLEEELKSHAQYLKSQITEVTATINRISQELGRGKRSENVKCHWIFNDPKRGAKTLYRLDVEPKEYVRMDKMTASDRQLTLDDLAAQKAKTERTLAEKEVTPITNQPYEGEVLTDKEVEAETGIKPESDDPDDNAAVSEGEADYGEASDHCPI